MSAPLPMHAPEFRDRDFDLIAASVEDYCGIHLARAKCAIVASRLLRRLPALGLSSLDEYAAYLRSHSDQELPHLINAVTTNLTALFREPHHFEALRSRVLPWHRSHHPNESLEVWSAGCSTGLESWSIAITLRNAGVHQFRIMATDIDSQVLTTARAGVYPIDVLDGMQPEVLRWFQRGVGRNDGRARVKPALEANVTFEQLNLNSEWHFERPFHVIFCRNVLIYFEPATRQRLVERFADALVQGGHLYVGHSESLAQLTGRFTLVGRTHYTRTL